jgi:hypothetical protein
MNLPPQAIRPRRPRRIAADEAHAWARNLRLGNPYAKLVLCMLTLYVDGDGGCFVSINQLAEDCEFGAETIRRRLAWLESIGVVVRMPQWIDEHGRRNADAKGRRTSDLIRLLIDADLDAIEAKVGPIGRDGDDDHVADPPTVTGGHGEGVTDLPPRLPPPLTPSLRRGPESSEPEPEEKKDSPLPPKGGEMQDDDDGWKEFEDAWQEPILRQSIARQVWGALLKHERDLACRAARGYVIWRKRQPKPPNVMNAHTFLRETDAHPKFAAILGEPDKSLALIDAEIPDGQALTALYEIARTRPFVSAGKIAVRGGVTPQLQAMAWVPPRGEWLWIAERNQIGSWREFVDRFVMGARPEMLLERNGSKGIFAPWPWPPRRDGSLCTGPPDPETAAEQPADEFAKTS